MRDSRNDYIRGGFLPVNFYTLYFLVAQALLVFAGSYCIYSNEETWTEVLKYFLACIRPLQVLVVWTEMAFQ